MPLHYVAPEYLPSVWQIVAPMLQKAIDLDPQAITIEQVEFNVRTGKSILIVWEEPNEGITGAAIFEIIDYPRQRVAHINLMGGKGIVRKDVFEEVKTLMRKTGAMTVQCWANGALVEMYKKIGMENTHQVMRIKL